MTPRSLSASRATVLVVGIFGPLIVACARPDINAAFRNEALDPDEYVERFEGESREVFSLRDEIVTALRIAPGSAVADVGSGTGAFLAPLARAVGPQGRIYALEIAPRFVDFIAQRAQTEGLPQVEARLCSETSVELPEASIDVAFVCDTYHHFAYPQQTLASLYAALRPGGRLFIVDFVREPGLSSDWVLDHVRCGREQVVAEVELAGFRRLPDVQLFRLRENYLIGFERP
jgi:predicted methyltransferase